MPINGVNARSDLQGFNKYKIMPRLNNTGYNLICDKNQTYKALKVRYEFTEDDSISKILWKEVSKHQSGYSIAILLILQW